jgi:tripartite-type tricarboxylate transporter receptor subunit TctC
MSAWKILLALCLASLATAANAASWPDRPIHWIVPYPPGGGTDLLARVIGAQLEKSLGQPIVVDNRPGGSTVTGTAVLASAEPDGYTIGMVFDSHTIRRRISRRLSSLLMCRWFSPSTRNKCR